MAVTKAIEIASPLFESRQHRMKVEVASRGLTVMGDEYRLARVVSNLLTNAAEYTDPGGTVEVRAWREAGE